ncbi:MAG: response regulator transcription factor [Porticoccaceae bacterium]|jgi:DNA-binding NarL/FixJ family response regulator|nr:response regulator transcription factor [Cellvibrionales bacterium]MDA8866275.1 response regulator transcription factor [Porticoccaceae bacterium]MDA8898350.1 response regulator transcription factor [Porticoccaceae bacterium]MDB3926266.1 response regulator transcription factor [Porticoccaceae bacterium]
MHILIVDDHAFVCAGLKATLLDTLDDIQVTTTERGEEVLSILGKEDIDIIILDLFMPGGYGGFGLIGLLHERYPSLPIIVLSASENSTHIRKCFELGVTGFVTKSAPKEALIEAIAKALEGERYVPKYLIESVAEVARVFDEVDSGVNVEIIAELITDRQFDILSCISRGHSNKQIARELELSENTVKVHVSAMLKSLGLSNRTQAGILGQKLGLAESVDIEAGV